jgi:hypothetical protein
VRRLASVALLLALAGAPSPAALAGDSGPASRVVVVKIDGLPPGAVARYVRRTAPRTGRSVLPWIDRLFFASGVRFENFYARGASLSEPSWAIIDTGQHGIIKGNYEVDRNTGAADYYLGFMSYYYDVFKARRVYPPSVEALDAARTPMISDAFRYEERETGLQLNRRGTKFYDLLSVGLQPVTGPIRERLGDLVVGVDLRRAFDTATRDAFFKALRDPSIRYVEFYSPNVDEALHDDSSEKTLLAELRELDRVLGRAYAAVVESGTADRTIFAVVSDHGMTYDLGGQYSQGVNLVEYLTRRPFCANNVMAHDGPRAKYSLKGSIFKPWIVGSVVTPSAEPFVAGRPDRVTCAVDYDGNERAHLQLRSPDLNRLELLVGALRSGRREAAERAALAVVERRRAAWSAEAAEIRAEIAALRRLGAAAAAELARVGDVLAARRRAGAKDEPALGPYEGLASVNAKDRTSDLEQRENELRAMQWRYARLEEQYAERCESLELRASVRTADALVEAPADKLFGAFDLGDRPSAADLASYPAGLREVALDDAGALDEQRSFETVNYLEALTGLRVRNGARAELGAAPVAFCAVALPVSDAARRAAAAGLLAPADAASATAAYLLYGSARDQLVVFVRAPAGAEAALLAVPVTGFRADAGSVAFDAGEWRAGLPLGLFEDPALDTRGEDRLAWLSSYHADREWLAAAHETANGLGVPALVEVLSPFHRDAFAAAAAADATEDARLLRRLELRRRDAAMPDLFVHAAPHWNFDVKDFNPGGNHGGFGRQSMHAVFWIRGGERTGVAAGPLAVATPYDGLDFAPTILEAAGVTVNGRLPAELVRAGFRPYPGRVASEALRRAE